MEKMDGKTMDIVAENVAKLKELFPEAFTEGKVDFDALKEVLGTFVDDRDERYSFTWNGKSKARMIAQTPSSGTLRPCKEESVDWDSTQNIFIEGDNLEVLKLLQKSYHKKVKMIYIDPPYNTGKDFVYKDNFKDNIKNYKEITGQLDGDGRNISNNPETSGRYHSDWLNMMYPRLKLARNIMKDDGVILISIDDNEVSNLRTICDEIFGEENFIGTFVVNATPNGRDYGHIAKNHEFCIFYSKNIDKCETTLLPDLAKTFKYQDNISGFNIHPLYNSNEAFHKNNRKNLYYPFYVYTDRPIKDFGDDFYEIGLEKTTNSIEVYPPLSQKNAVQFVWRWGQEKALKNINQEIIGYKTSSGEYRIVQKMRTDEKLIRSIITGKEYTSRRGTAEVESLLGGKFFSFPKPLELLKKFVTAGMGEDSLMLDMFAGSSTSAEAVMRLNFEDKGKRKYVMIQFPENINEENKFETIAEISKERIRRSAAKIKEENPEYDGDLGFKVFKLDSTNIKPWEVDFDMTERTLEDFISNIKTDRREEDVLYEVLLKYGLDLTLPITEHDISGQKVFDIGMGALIICLSDAISLEVVEGIAKLKDELNPEIMRMVFKDSGFKDDVVKTNAVQILKQAGIVDVRSL